MELPLNDREKMKQQINPRPFVLAALIVAAGVFRLLTASGTLTPLTNFTPLGAMALFGGCYYADFTLREVKRNCTCYAISPDGSLCKL